MFYIQLILNIKAVKWGLYYGNDNMDDITNYTLNINEEGLTIEKIGGKALNLS